MDMHLSAGASAFCVYELLVENYGKHLANSTRRVPFSATKILNLTGGIFVLWTVDEPDRLPGARPRPQRPPRRFHPLEGGSTCARLLAGLSVSAWWLGSTLAPLGLDNHIQLYLAVCFDRSLDRHAWHCSLLLLGGWHPVTLTKRPNGSAGPSLPLLSWSDLVGTYSNVGARFAERFILDSSSSVLIAVTEGAIAGHSQRSVGEERILSPVRTSDVILLVVEAEKGDAAEELALRLAVRRTLGVDDQGNPWRVERLFRATGPEATALDRYYRVSGSVDAPAHRFEQAAFELAYRLSDVTGFHVEPDLPSSSFAPPEPDFTETLEAEVHLPASEPHAWALDAIRCRSAWQLPPEPGGASQGEGITIAHPDTGYTDHRDARADTFDLRRDRDFLANDDALDPLDTFTARPLVNPGHGTSTASVLAARKVTSIEGVAPKTTIVPLRTIKSVVQVFDSDVARAVDYARQIGAHVVSMSLGGTGFRGLREAIDHAVSEGLIVLAAAGNQVRFVVAPANYPNCIAVAATNADDVPWKGSSAGKKVAISAPGESVWVATYRFETPSGPQPILRRHHGTSFAVAHVAGAAALWLAHHGREALIERYGRHRLQAVFLHLIATRGHRRPGEWDEQNFGVGILDAEALLKASLPERSDVDSMTPELALEASATRPAGERVAVLFPDLTADQVEERLAALFGVSGDALAAKLDRYEAELVRMCSERPEAWNTFMSAEIDGASALDASATEAAPDVALAASVARFGSPTLAQNLEVGQ